MRQSIARLSDRLLRAVLPTTTAGACYFNGSCGCHGGSIWYHQCCPPASACGCVPVGDC
jgi:hypothetical protein